MLIAGIHQIQVELIQVRGETLKSEIHKFINLLGTRTASAVEGVLLYLFARRKL
jgi:hypothetical protein